MEVIQNFDSYIQNDMFRLGFFYGIIVLCILLIFVILVSKISIYFSKNKDK